MSDFSENERDDALEPSEDEGAQAQEPDEEIAEIAADEPTRDAPVVYRWNYDEQVAHDKEQKRREQRRGVILFASVMSSVFLLCIAVLLGVIVWMGVDDAEWGTHDLSEIGAVAQAVNPSTVLIEATESRGVSYGTGFFLTENGYIATNHHVIDGAESVKVTLYSGAVHTAEVVGFYALDDLAVLKINGSGYPVLPVGNSDTVLVGDLAVVVGNPSGPEAAWTTTHGIISSTARRVIVTDGVTTGAMKMIQTDAPVNPGNSGGPLCNVRGEVIGIIVQKLPNYEGIGFAIPISEAMHTLQAIIDGEEDVFTSTVTKKRPTIGITVENVKANDTYEVDGETFTAPCDGLLVAGVTEGSGAVGVFEYGDLLYEFDGTRITNMQELQNVLFTKSRGDRVKVKIYRGGNSMEVEVKLS